MIVKIFFLLVLVQGAWNASMETKRKDKDSGDFTYPGPMKDMTLKDRVTGTTPDDLPEACRGQNYCTIKPPNYPEEAFNKMFKGKKVVPAPSLVKTVAVFNRQGDPDLKDNCDSTVTYEPLYRVTEVETGEWYTVIQAPEADYVQAVRLETCLEQGNACFTVFPTTSEIKTSCEQKYNHWEVMVSDGKNGTKKIKAELPVCCACRYKVV